MQQRGWENIQKIEAGLVHLFGFREFSCLSRVVEAKGIELFGHVRHQRKNMENYDTTKMIILDEIEGCTITYF